MKIRDDAWILSDTHFGHSNIIKYANRPFLSTEEMDEQLIANWNKNVSRNDQVIFLGDFSLAHAEEVNKYCSRLNGEIILLLGNHDREHSPQWWHEAGFDHVLTYPFVYKDYFILSHEPVEWVSERLPVMNIHGHIHEKTHYNMGNNHYNVSVENINYAPVRLADILSEGYVLNKL